MIEKLNEIAENILKYLLIAFIVFFSIVIMIFHFIFFPIVKRTTLFFPRANETLYLQTYEHGYAGESGELLYISTEPQYYENENENYIINGQTVENYFYIIKEDTLIIYINANFSSPKEFNSKVVVRINKIYVDDYFDLCKSYKSKGLKLLPVH